MITTIDSWTISDAIPVWMMFLTVEACRRTDSRAILKFFAFPRYTTLIANVMT